MAFLKVFGMLLGIFLTAYLAYAGYYFANQRKIIFPVAHIPVTAPDLSQFPQLEQIPLTTTEGKVEAWFLPPIEDIAKPYPVVIIAHGNGELIDFYPAAVTYLRKQGLGILLVEYPGYGRSEGEPSKKSIAEVYTLAYDTVTKWADVDAARVVLLGISLGGGAVTELAQVRPTRALILVSTFTSIKDYAKTLYLPPILIRDPYDNLAVVRDYPYEILIIHGERDELIPYQMGLALYEAAQHGTMISYDCGHNDCILSWELFWGDVTPFLQKVGVVE